MAALGRQSVPLHLPIKTLFVSKNEHYNCAPNIGQMTTKFSLNINQRAYSAEYKFEEEVYPRDVTMLDEQRAQRDLKVSGFAPSAPDEVIHCRWDRAQIKDTCAIVPIPVRRQYESASVEYTSSLNGNVYKIQDHINHNGAVYLTDGYACSPNCARAFIISNSHDPLFSDAESLLAQLLGYMPTAAPSWRILKGNGGNVSIEKFRENLDVLEFSDMGVATRPIFFVYGKQYTLTR